MPGLVCPRCREALAAVEVEGTCRYACPGCGGRAANVALLRKLVPQERVNDLWRGVREAAGDHGAGCPACRHAMTVVSLDGEAGLELDACRRCQLVWFDPGERERLGPEAEPRPRAPAREVRPARAAVRGASGRSGLVADAALGVVEAVDLVLLLFASW